jgi:hypothetical protein
MRHSPEILMDLLDRGFPIKPSCTAYSRTRREVRIEATSAAEFQCKFGDFEAR